MTSGTVLTPTTILQTPTQAAQVFTQQGFAKQRNVYIVRFVSPVMPVVQDANSSANMLTYVIKTVDRPKLNMKVEELNEYNKRRQVLTGYKLEPVRIQFYDSADSSALNMWITYGRYYYGDLNIQSSNPGGGTANPSYAYDATTNGFADQNSTGFGFTARNGASQLSDAQFFFDRIELYHFYNGNYDLYYLIHPRIQMFEPDDLDYEQSAISLISMSVVYENLQYFPQQSVQNTSFPEFENLFAGNPVPYASPSVSNLNQQVASVTPSNPSVFDVLGGAPTAAAVQDYRYSGAASTGALGTYGNFGFGPTGVQAIDNLSAMTLGNPALNVALNVGSTVNAALSGISGAVWDVLSAPAQAAAVAANFGTMATTIATGVLSAGALSSQLNAAVTGGALALSPATYGLINAQQTGTAQFGFNAASG